MQTELAILGGGPGGYAAAFRAADLGLKPVLIEARPTLGGVCLLEGCIPSKALLHVARGLAVVEELREWGIKHRKPSIDIDAVRDRKNQVISELTGGLNQLAKARKVPVIQARGRFESSTRLRLEATGDSKLDEDTVDFDKLILATGSSPFVPGPLRVDSDRLMTSREALSLPEVPDKLLVIGGAYIGLEMGTTYARLGSEVTVVEMLENLLPGVDADLVKPLHAKLKPIMKDIHVRTRVTGIEPVDDGLKVTMDTPDGEKTETFDRVLVAVGRKPDTGGIGLENTAVELDEQGFARVDASQRTADGHILAIGDITGQPNLAHKAFHEGYVAAELLTGRDAEFDRRAIPAVIFTDPEIAYAGLTETEARDRGIDVAVAKYPWAASGRAHAIGRGEGVTKLLFDPDSDRLVGAGIVGDQAGELIAECVLAIETGATATDLAETVHAHPTLAETVGGAGMVRLGLATEVRSRRR